MLDTTSIPAAMTAAWRDHISVGDVVLFRYPCAAEDDTEAPKSRPCLVLDIETIGDQRYALLAYGTTSASGANRGYEIRVGAAPDLVDAGLHRPTRFIGARRLLVSLASPNFVPFGGTGAPVVGRLTGLVRERMHAVRARIHAERDIAAERRASRRRRSTERARAPRPVVVEIRRTKRPAIRKGATS